MANIEYKYFKDVNLRNSFFDSLRKDYQGFDDWYSRKTSNGEKAYVFYENDNLLCFLYLKEESPVDNTNIIPSLDTTKSWVKVGTFKAIEHQTKLGERLIKRMFDFAISKNIFNLYVTIFPKHEGLIKLLKQYGFYEYGKKGDELVLVKHIATSYQELKNDILLDFPALLARGVNKYILGILPIFHTRLFSESKLNTESFDILQDLSSANSIHKIYICAIKGVETLQKGDILIIYRTKDDNAKSANFSSVATSLCIVEEYKNINNFSDIDAFLSYTKPHSVFSDEELKTFYKNKQYPKIIKMSYNIAFKKRVVLNKLRTIFGKEPKYWGFVPLNDNEFKVILKAGEVNESIIIN